MGIQSFPLKELTPSETKSVTLDIRKSIDPNDPQNLKARGQITMEMTYNPFREDENLPDDNEDGEVEKAPEGTPSGGGLLVVRGLEAEDVEGKHHTNPYVRLLLRGEEKKTKPVKKNRDPRWDQEFEFVLEDPPVNEKLHVEVMSKGSGLALHSRETLGYVDINLSDVVNNKRINEKYHLIDSKNGKIQIELLWRSS